MYTVTYKRCSYIRILFIQTYDLRGLRIHEAHWRKQRNCSIGVCKSNDGVMYLDYIKDVIVQLEFELAYYDTSVHCFNHYTTKTSPILF